MPITPFHFGPGAVIHALAPQRVSFIAFCAANVLIDVEPLYFMLTNQFPLHRFFHTYVGALPVALATISLFYAARWFAARFWLPNVFGWRALGRGPVVLGAALGSISHIVLDSIMHGDIRPFAPFSQENPLLMAVSLSTLYLACLLAGLAALIIVIARKWLARQTAR